MSHYVMYKRNPPVDMPAEYRKGMDEIIAEIEVSEGRTRLASKHYFRASNEAMRNGDISEWRRLRDLGYQYMGDPNGDYR